jgi:GT2 family glycosyltransferase
MTSAEHDIPDVSVVICSHSDDRWESLAAAVASVRQQSLPAREILVVVDHNARLLERARTGLSGALVLENREQHGLSGARNTGVQAAQGELIAFLDDDAVAAPDWLAALTYACMDRRVLGSGGLVEPAWQGQKPGWLPREFYWVVGCSYRGMPETTGRIRNPIGANMCIRADVFETVGGFSSRVGRVGTRPAGCEETELCIRALRQWPQGMFLYEPAAKICHAVPPRRTSWRYFCSRCFQEGRSKALVTRSVGARHGLASERAFATRTLPAAIVQGVADAFLRRDAAGLARAGAIITGLAATAAGYATASVEQHLERGHRWLTCSLSSSLLQQAIFLVLPVVALILWSVSLAGMDVRHMTDLGLVTALPASSLVALAVLLMSFCVALRQAKLPVAALLVHLLLLVYMLYGITPLVEAAPRFDATYWIAGHTEYIVRTGATNPYYDAYFSWPGFFVLHGLAAQLAGYQSVFASVAAWASWAPLFYNLLYLGPLYIILRSATTDTRVVWLGLLFFYITDWVWQDYFAPQGLNFFLYLVILAILLRWWIAPASNTPRANDRSPRRFSCWPRFLTTIARWLGATDIVYTPGHRRQRIGLLGTVVAAFALAVFSHPLTPFLVLATVTPLIVVYNRRLWWLPCLMAAMVVGWDAMVAQPYIVGHMDAVFGSFGNLGAFFTSNVTSRAGVGSAEHQLIARLRIVSTGALWGLAALGATRRVRAHGHDAPYVLLAVAPFTVLFVQSYDGEMFMRAYMFTLPAISFFAAAAVCTPSTSRLSARRTGLIALTAFALLSCFLFTRYGNERADYYTSDELNAVRYLYQTAPRSSLLIAACCNPAWEFQGLDQYTYISLDPEGWSAAARADDVANLLADEQYQAAYVIFTRSERAQAQMYNNVSPKAFDQFEQTLLQSGQFRVIYSTPDAQILEYVEAPG